MNLRGLKPSFLNLSDEEQLALVLRLRESRHTYKVKASPKKKAARKKKVEKFSTEDIEEIIKALKGET